MRIIHSMLAKRSKGVKKEKEEAVFEAKRRVLSAKKEKEKRHHIVLFSFSFNLFCLF